MDFCSLLSSSVLLAALEAKITQPFFDTNLTSIQEQFLRLLQVFSGESFVEYLDYSLGMSPNQAFILLALSIDLATFPHNSVAEFMCRPCESESECNMPPPVICEFGEVRNACNRRECAKGPGSRCGGPMDILGQCAENLMCHSDEICHGWFLETLQNYE